MTPVVSTFRCQPIGTWASCPLPSPASLSFPPFMFMDQCLTLARDHTLFSVLTKCLILMLRRAKTEHNNPDNPAHSTDRPRLGLITWALNADRQTAASTWPTRAMRRQSYSRSGFNISRPKSTKRMERVVPLWQAQGPAGSAAKGSVHVMRLLLKTTRHVFETCLQIITDRFSLQAFWVQNLQIHGSWMRERKRIQVSVPGLTFFYHTSFMRNM